MELIDVLNEKGEKTGEVLSRKEIHANGIWHACVHIWILNSKGELLVQKRAKHVKHFPKVCDVSVCGHVSSGETIIEGTLKELKEELGLERSEKSLILLERLKVSALRADGGGVNNHFDSVYLIKEDISLDEIKIQEEEVETVQYIPWRELEKTIAKNDGTLVRRVEEYKMLFEYLENEGLF